MAIEGPLKELHIHDVFQLLDLGRKTGVLRVTSELRQNAGTVFFEQGTVVGAEIRSNPHPLGGLLRRAGKLTEEELTRARALQDARPGVKLGAVLIEMGIVTARELDRQIRLQVEEVVFELMSWSEGYFSFVEGSPGQTTADAEFRIPTEALLMEAARRIDEWSQIESRIPHLGVVPRLNPLEDEDTGTLDLLPFEWSVLATIDGRVDIRQLADRLGRSNFDVAKTLFGLASADIIVLEDKSPAARPAAQRELAMQLAEAEGFLAAGETGQARMVAEEAVLSHPDDALAHLALGRVLLAEGRYDEAAQRCAHAVETDPGSADGLRLLGLAEAALGRFGHAVEAWDRWRLLPDPSPADQALRPMVEAWRAAAAVLADGLREKR